uniref:Putative N-acetylneuraminate synthase n=1 Tax=viral metagenome TaxID=1070528 RepID=A0A6M3IX64_9ZZZZ
MKCEIIAEIGINHGGNLQLAKDMVSLAKSAGADVAKFQLYDPEKLLKKEDFTRFDWNAIMKSKLSHLQTIELKNYCDKEKIEFMASAFDYERLGWLEEIGVKRHKIASRMIYDKDYCEAVKATYKPYLVSTGFIRGDNPLWESAEDTWRRIGRKEFKASWLYCISKYPTLLKDVGFNHYTFTEDLCQNWKWYDGFSDHTIGLAAAKVAISLGAKIIEKHFTLDNTLPGPDQVCSMLPKELFELVKFRDEFAEIMGE